MDLSSLRGCGLQPGEEQLPEGDAPANQAPAVEVDEGVVMQLASMGFDVEGCKKAVYHTQNQGKGGERESRRGRGLVNVSVDHLSITASSSGVEAAMNWVLEHMGDPG